MNARRTAQRLVAAALLAALLAAGGAAFAAPGAPAQNTPPPSVILAQALRTEGKRQAPLKLGVNIPRQVSFEVGPVQHIDVTPDGKWLAYTRISGGYSELWLRSLDESLTLLPRRIAPALADRLSPALSPDGKRIAFIGTEDDVKGDVYLLDLTQAEATPAKLTGRDTEDGAPCFSPDGRTLYFDQRAQGAAQRKIVALSLGGSQRAVRVVETDGDASTPAISPDGTTLAFVSSRTGMPAVHLVGVQGGSPRKLTTGLAPETSPRFTPDGLGVLFSTAPYGLAGGTADDLLRFSVIGAASAARQEAPKVLNSAQGASLEPVQAGQKFYYLATRAGSANVWSLPPEGEIPVRPAEELLALAEAVARQLPVDRPLAVLAYGKAAEAAQMAGGAGPIAAKALLAQGRQFEAMKQPAAAKAAYAQASALPVQPEAGLARIRSLLLDAASERTLALNDKARLAAMQNARKQLEDLARQAGDPTVAAQARIEQARLLIERSRGSQPLIEALRILESLTATTGVITDEQAAEALYLKTEAYARIGQAQAVLPLYARVIKDYPDKGQWADLAVGKVLDRSLSGMGEKFEDRAQALSQLAEQYRRELPKLSLGALNRMGDVYYTADEWTKAKDAYRQSLGTQKDNPQLATQIAAARLSLAEILYREERFHQALDLYESEMASRPYEDRLYRLAKAAHLRKSTAAGDYLLRIGEVPSARSIFASLLQDAPDYVPAHRGMIRASAALRTIPATLAEYRAKLAAKPGDPTLLYATGLTLTYLDGKPPLLEARGLIQRAILKNGQVEYFHQTLGYIEEVLETVHGERGRLEAALDSYQRARFLNSREQNPENAANLDLNIGNIHFLLGQYANAFEEYRKRQQSQVAFDNEETEILFYQRFGTSAFQARERDKPIEAFAKSLELVERRIQPKYASEVFGHINKYVFDRVLTPALGRPEAAQKAKELAARQSELNNRLFEASITPVGPPPDPAWGRYVKSVEALLAEQERIVAELPPLLRADRSEQAGRDATMQTLGVMATKVREALGFPPRFVQLRAELHDRLGLAYQEAGRWREARESFEKALGINTALGLNQNLAANQRSVAYNAFMEAGLTTGQDRDRLLILAEDGFRRVPLLVKQHGVADKQGGGRKKGLINIDLNVSLDKATSSQAAFGFSAEQEVRVAEAFLARIATERGKPAQALDLVSKQLAPFASGTVQPQDAFGAALLMHRAGLLESSLGREGAAFERFRRSAELALELRNPLSASLNVADMAALLANMPTGESGNGKTFSPRLAALRRLEARTAEALSRNPGSRASLTAPTFHNLLAASSIALADNLAAGTPGPLADVMAGSGPEHAAMRTEALQRAGIRVADGLAWFKNNPPQTRRAFALQAALHLNRATLAERLGEERERLASLQAALELSRRALLPGVSWRALAGLGNHKDALAILEALPLDALDCGPGEVRSLLGPLVATLADAGKAEDAFNMLERLSELERVGRMARLGVARPGPGEQLLLRRTGMRLLALRDLKARAAVAKGQDALDLTRRMEQEREILQRDLGPGREALPGVARLASGEAQQDWLIILFGLSAEASAIADAAVSAGAVSTDDGPDGQALRTRHAELSARIAALKAELAKDLARQDSPGPLGLLLTAPVEAIDVMENLPKGSKALRIAALPGLRWLGIGIDADSVRLVNLEAGMGAGQGAGLAPTLPALQPGERRIVVSESLDLLPREALRSAQSTSLSGSHLLRSLRARKPFRRNLLFVSGSFASPKTFQATTLPADAMSKSDALGLSGALALPDALESTQTLVATAQARMAHTAPTRQDDLPVRFLALAPEKGEPLPLADLASRMRDVSLAVLTQAEQQDVDLLAHLFSLYGVPSVLVSPGAAPKSFVEPFLVAYEQASVTSATATALAAAKPSPGSAWLLLGDPGLNSQEAATFAATQFTKYVRTGLEAFKAGRYEQSLALFENALRVARADGPAGQFSKHLPDLLSYGRESAYAYGAYEKSLAFAQELALLLAKTRPDTPAHAEALMRLGLVQARLEHYGQAIPVLTQAADMLANLELTPKEIEALSNLGVVLENAIQFDQALTRFQSAAKLSQKSGSQELVAKQYMSIGRIYDMRLSQYAQARGAYGAALDIYTKLGRKAEMAQALLDIGRCARLIGSFPEAEDKYAQALKLITADKAQAKLQARIEMEQANNAWYQARFQQAFDLQRKVLRTAEQNGWVLEQVMARNTAGLLWWSLGDHERALRELEAALPLARSLRIRQDEVATTLNNRGLVERDMGRTEQALKTLGEALGIDREIRSRWAIAYDLRNIAQTYIRIGDAKKALPLLDEALGIVASTGNRINQAKILLAQGEANLALGNAEKARAAYTQADELSRSMALRDSQWRALHGLARLDLAAGKRPEARALLEKATEVIEGMRAELKVDQLKDGFIADKAVVYEDLVTLLADMGEVAESFRTAERSRARNLIDLLGNKRRAPQRKEDQALYDRIATVRAGLREQESLLASAQNQNEREVYARGVKRLQDEYRDILLELQANRPDVASLVSVNPLTLAEVQKLLEPGVGLVTYYVTAQEVLAWTVTPDKVALTRSRLGRESLGKMVLTYRRMLQNLEPADTHSKELYGLLVAPVLPTLAGVTELGIVPHDALHTLAFATLTDGDSYLVDLYPLFQLPSASVYRFTLERRKAERNTQVLAVGNPDLRDQSLELPFAEREVGSLAWNYPNMTALTGEKATKSWITENISRFGIIHLATHGEFDQVNPLFSALKLVSDKKDPEGDLEAAEIFDLRINADLIVLSACQTGLGKVSGGDEVQGMNQAFLYAGTHALVSSLWRVSDISTAMLMKQFYREYQTRPKAESLRRAMLHVKNRYPHPGYWGAFTLTGDYK